jgi:hypothetical protein
MDRSYMSAIEGGKGQCYAGGFGKARQSA